MASATPQSAELPKIKLYWLEQSRSQRILWLLEELKVPYEIEIFHREPKTRLAPPELKEVHPLGKSPVIAVTPVGSTQPVIIAESAFVVEYLLDHFSEGSNLLPKRYKEGQEGKLGGETEEWLRFRYFMNYAEGTLMNFLMLSFVSLQIKTSPAPFFIKPITSAISGKINSGFVEPNLKANYAFLEAQLDSSPDNGQYLCGPHLTGADILLSFPLIAARGKAPLTKDHYPKLYAYIDKLEAEPGYKRAVQQIVEIEGKFEATF